MISILMTAYNAERYIRQAIESIQNQTYTDWELTIIDDCSTDKTLEIIEKYDDDCPNIISHSSIKNAGHTRCLNVLLDSCRGDYIAWHDADDISHPKRFERQVQELGKYGLCTTHGITISERGKRVKNWYTDSAQREKKTTIHDKLRTDCWLLLPSLMFRREVVEKIGGFDEECYYAQDFNFFLRALKAGYDFSIIPEELFKFRKHGKNVRSSGKFKNKNWHKFAIERAKKCPVIKST